VDRYICIRKKQYDIDQKRTGEKQLLPSIDPLFGKRVSEI
jgi:hypothetical protein